jgi:peptidoglycan/LPS O-acetylase OafA/YrhL
LIWFLAYVVLASDQTLLSPNTRFRLNLSLAGRMPAFLFGIAAAWAVLRYGERIRDAMRKKAWLRNGGSDLLLLASLFALGLILQKVTERGFIQSAVTMPAWHLVESLLWTTVVLLIVLAPLRMHSVISNRAMGILGLLSYSLYLVHEPILFFGLGPLVGRGVPLDVDLTLRIMAFLAAIAVCIGLSAVTYRLIERPFLVRKAKVGR